VALPGFGTDFAGVQRHPEKPCRGALELVPDDGGFTAGDIRDKGGRLIRRKVQGRVQNLGYDGRNRLTRWDWDGSAGTSCTYDYDHAGRRILTRETVGGATKVTRYVYDGADVCAEYEDSNNDGAVDRTRVYWLLPGMDRRIGFAENVNGTNTFYYYLTDQVGTVLRIVKEDGTVVNQYDYDAFGRVRQASSSTFVTVENRYLFQGREWDKNGGFYYFRNRIYLPERGEFSSPDMNLGRGILGELDGMATLTFCGGDPVNCIDPTGLDVLSWMFGYGFSGAEATAFEKGFAEGYDGGSCIAANALTFGQIDSLKTRSERLVAEDDMYRTSQGLANFGNSMFMASGGTVLLKGGMMGLGVLAAKGGAIGTAATVTQVSAGCGLTVLAAKSAGDNLGTAAGEIDSGQYGWATFHASLGLLDIYSAGASSYGGYKTFSTKVVASKPVPEVNSKVSSVVPKGGAKKASSKTLGKALEKDGYVRPPDSAAHHIVAGDSKMAAFARLKLKSFGIDINDPVNGVFLPASRTSPNLSGAAVHSTLHTRKYYQAVNDAIGQATSKQELIEILNSLRTSLLKGGI
jgi:RHS repeat-associated protein